MQPINNSKIILSGPESFYSDHDKYRASTETDCGSLNPLPPSYVWTPPGGKMRRIKQILSYLILPIGLYKLFHRIIGGLLQYGFTSKKYLQKRRTQCMTPHPNYVEKVAPIEGLFKYKRFSIQVQGGAIIDCMMMVNKSVVETDCRRWVINIPGKGAFYESELGKPDHCFTKKLADQTQSHAILYNCKGAIGRFPQLVSREDLREAQRAIIEFLADKTHGMGATTIINHAHCWGGLVLDDTLKAGPLPQNVNYVNIWNKTFTSLSDHILIDCTHRVAYYVKGELGKRIRNVVGLTLGYILGAIAAGLIKLAGWDICPGKFSSQVKTMKNLFVQKVDKSIVKLDCSEFTDVNVIEDDAIIFPEVALARQALKEPNFPNENRICMGVHGDHNKAVAHWNILKDKNIWGLS